MWGFFFNIQTIWLFLMSQPESFKQFAGVLLGFFTILSGAPIGFLVSQIWYTFMNKLKIRSLMKMENACGLLWTHFEKISKREKDNEQFKKSEAKLVAVQNYIESHHDKYIRSYIVRRWDLLNLLGSSIIAVWCGTGFGYLVRYHAISQYAFPILLYSWNDLPIWLVTGLLTSIFSANSWIIFREHFSMLNFMHWLTINYANEPLYGKGSLDDILKEYLAIK